MFKENLTNKLVKTFRMPSNDNDLLWIKVSNIIFFNMVLIKPVIEDEGKTSKVTQMCTIQKNETKKNL